jgi:hypothetical protein
MISKDEYFKMREFFSLKGNEALENKNLSEADYCSGVVRGLDLAFQDNTGSRGVVFN